MTTIKYVYPKDKKGKKIGNTVAILVKDDMIFIGEAVCSPEDQFNKKIGRELALSRAILKYRAWSDNQKG